MREFKRGPCVVIEPTHEPIIQRKRHSYLGQDLLHRLKVHAAPFVQKLADAGQRFDNWLILRHFAVKYAQRIRHRSALAIRAHPAYDGLESFAKRLVERCSIIPTSNRIQLQIPARDSDTVEQSRKHLQNFRIARWRLAPRRRRTDYFRSDLIKLPVPPLLRSLPAKLRTNVVELVEPPIPEFVLDVGPHYTGCIFGTQRQHLPLLAVCPWPVLPRIHFLRDNVGLFAHTTRKQFRRLENWRANLLEVVSAEHIPNRRLHKIPQRRLRRQQIACPSHCFDHSVLSF